MYVVADIEWIRGKDWIRPTQIAAARVNGDWEVLREFQACAAVSHRYFIPGFVAFNGYGDADFYSAAAPKTVMRNFCKWLDDDDVLCWWNRESEAAFKQVLHDRLYMDDDWQHRIISVQIANDLERAGICVSGLYSVGKVLNVNDGLTAHYSVDDVALMLRILRSLEVTPDTFTENICMERTAKKSEDKLNYEMVLHGTLTPAQYNEYTLSKRQDVAFIRSAASKVFHRADCRLPIRSKNLEMYARFKTCLKKGLSPCKCCRPSEDDERLAPGKKQASKNIRDKVISGTKHGGLQGITLSDITGKRYDVPQRTLNSAEIMALRRYMTARRERYFIMTRDDLSEQEKTDLLTLARTDCMFWGGRGYDTFHLKHCVKLKGLTRITGFSRAKDAIRDGYRPCRLCKPATRKGLELTLPYFSKAVPGESVEIVRERCLESGLIYRMVDGCPEIETGFGIWRIKCDSIPYRLYHINKVVEPNNDTDFHQQPHIFLSLSDVVAYIVNHDRKLGRVKVKI